MVRSTVDTGALSHAVSRPGIDPRSWLSLAVVEALGFDQAHGVFADIRYLPSGDTDTALVGSQYAGGGFGTLCPPKVEDVVLVAVPDGHTGLGPVIIARMWSKADPPPVDFAGENDEPTTDPTTRVEDGATFRIVAKAGANVRIELEGAGSFTVEATGAATVNLSSETSVTIQAPDVRIGSTPGGREIACVGDLAAVYLPRMTAGGYPVIPVPPALPTASGGIAGTAQIISGVRSAKAGA